MTVIWVMANDCGILARVISRVIGNLAVMLIVSETISA